jgi:uncharacterized protein
MYERLLIERHVAVPMRDGTTLRADVYRPDTVTPVPVILARLPYDKDNPRMRGEAIDAPRAAEAGFAIVYQDTRGRYRSEGDFYPFVHEGVDGFDTIEWLARQPWCSGAVGMIGASYFGATQWLAAVEQPPHLKAIFPIVTASDYYEGWTYQGGAFQLGFTLLWTLSGLAPDVARRLSRDAKAAPDEWARIAASVDQIDDLYQYRPLSRLPILRESASAPYYFDWIEHSSSDEYWRRLAINRRYRQVEVPAFNVGGWYDLFLHGTIENYVRMRAEGGTGAARQGQRLLIGPWAHGNFSGAYPERNFGAFASADAVDLTSLALGFFGEHLRGVTPDMPSEPPARLFVMGDNRWRSEDEWPLKRTRYERWYLHSAGDAAEAGGRLAVEGPGDEPVDRYTYHPSAPTPTVGGPTFLPALGLGANAGPRDQRSVESRADVLVFTSEPLNRPLEVTGPLVATLYVATDAPDTDFVTRLCDVFPDGASRILAEGILSGRFREGTDQPRPLAPGEVTEFRIDLVATSNVFLAGHRVRLDVCSASFPRFDANPNTWGPLGEVGSADLRPARQVVFHDAARPSHVVLPIIPH